MKNTLSLSALFILCGYAIVDLSRTAGVVLPDVLNVGTAFLAFLVVTSALLLVADYGPKARPIALPVPTSRCVARPQRHSVAAAYRHVYAIRRGAEAARLAKAPGHIVVFPRHTPSRRQRAA